MPGADTFTSQIEIRVDGIPLAPVVSALLVSAEVESSMFLPDTFHLTFRGSRAKVLENGRFQIAAEVDVSMMVGMTRRSLILGEITAIEIDFGRGGNLTVVTGSDKSHRMMAGTNARTYVEMPSSDIVASIVAKHGMKAGEITPTTTMHPVVTQANVSDWTFVQQLAFRENRDAYMSNGVFNFTAPKLASEGETAPVLNYQVPIESRQLVLGRNLLHLHAVVSGVEQVPTVEVMGWDPFKAAPVMGQTTVSPSSSQLEDRLAQPMTVAAELGAKQYRYTDWPCDSEGAAESMAKSVATQIAGSFAEMEGECDGDPDIGAGAVVSLGMAGEPFDGRYVVSSARHQFTPGSGGYTTWFTVGGRRDRGLAGMGAASEPRLERATMPGVAVGLVVQANDPEEQCRVKIKYPWLDETVVSDWVRTVQLGAGEGYGFVIIPEVGTEVLVAFDHGDLNHPYIIGNLYNGMARPSPPPALDPAGPIGERRIESRKHHMLQFQDGPADMAVNLATGGGECTVALSASGAGGSNTITISSTGQVVIKGATDIQIEAQGDMALKAMGMLSLAANGEISIQSETALAIKANTDIALSASGQVSVAGAMIQLGG